MALYRRGSQWGRHTILLLFAFLTFYPFLFMVMISLKNNNQFYHFFWSPIVLPIEWNNYALAWNQVRGYILNSMVVSAVSIMGVLAIASPTAYAFARGNFPGRNALFGSIIALMMFPGVLTLIPSFHLVNWMGLLNTYWVMILPAVAYLQILSIYILRTFFESQQAELFEAARMDGATELRAFWHIALPLARPVLGVVAIITLLSTWNDFIWPLLTVTKADIQPITVGLTYFASGTFRQAFGPLMAGYTIASLPLIVLFGLFMRTFIEGMSAGAVKL
jgi:ABC-type glycerol-3-phosphate transport system permease component